jgi:hypothetical protein
MIVCVVVCVDVCVRTKVDPLMQSKSFLLGPELEGVRRSANPEATGSREKEKAAGESSQSLQQTTV